MYTRTIEHRLKSIAFSGKAILLLWPRQVGKTTLIKKLIEWIPASDYLFFSGDYSGDRRSLWFENSIQMERIVGNARWILIDEGQKIPDIGNIVKAIVDRYGKEKQVIVTGSSSIGLLDYVSEPLTGRKRVFHLFPIAFSESVQDVGLLATEKQIEDFLLYGMYPDILSMSSEHQKIQGLQEIVSGQLYRDILEFQQVKNSDVIVRLLELLALQIGSEVSYHKLAQILGVSQSTVERYVDLLEKSFIVFRLRPYVTNKKKEVTKMKKIYFYDLGIRNSLLRAFSPLSLRQDVWALFENFFIAERQKKIAYEEILTQWYFWRTNNQEEVDYLEASDRLDRAFECKWSKQTYQPPKAFLTAYTIMPTLIHRENISEFL